MKRRGISYTEILVSITIFSLGVVPLMLSLGSSFEATLFNRDYTKALEYNTQLIEEISAMMPTKVEADQYSTSEEGEIVKSSLETLYVEIKEMLEKRSESNQNTSNKKGIYHLVKWNEEKKIFDFDGYNYDTQVDKRFYRIVEVGSLKGSSGDEVREFDILVRCFNQRSDEEITQDVLVVNLKESIDSSSEEEESSREENTADPSIGNGMPYEGVSGSINIGKKSSGILYVNPDHEVKATSIKVVVESVEKGSKPGNIDRIRYKVNDFGSFTIMSRSGSNFNANIEVPVGAKIAFELRNGGNPATKNIRLSYTLDNK